MATVFVWNNNQITTKVAAKLHHMATAKEIIGHASMHITDDFAPFADEETGLGFDENHVSWLPAGDTDRDKKVEAELGPNLLADLMFEECAPDHVIRIPSPPSACTERMQKERDRHEELKNKRAQRYDFIQKTALE